MDTTPTLVDCHDLASLVQAIQASGAKQHYPSPYHAGGEFADHYTEWRTPTVNATLQIVEGDGGYSLTARIGGREYIIVLELDDHP